MMDFYEENHQQYFNSTVSIDPGSFLEPFVGYLAPKATILDVGCGSGRDLRWLAKRGFASTGFEKSSNLARLARQHSACPVIEGDLHDYDFSQLSFSALVYVGSLVHLSHAELPVIFKRICGALAPRGHILVTLKEGAGTSASADGRVFTLWSAEDLEALFTSLGFQILDFSRQVSRLRPDDIWLGYVLRAGNGS
jgi:SAM-dependent methyltransferase